MMKERIKNNLSLSETTMRKFQEFLSEKFLLKNERVEPE
jgi:hypothetical protein